MPSAQSDLVEAPGVAWFEAAHVRCENHPAVFAKAPSVAKAATPGETCRRWNEKRAIAHKQGPFEVERAFLDEESLCFLDTDPQLI